MLKKVLMILFNVIIVLCFLFLTIGMIDIIVNEFKYYLEIGDEDEIFYIIIEVIYIISIWSTYLSCYLKNKFIKKFSLSAIIISLFLTCIVSEVKDSLSWILFLYLPIIVVFIFAIIKNRRKAEV